MNNRRMTARETSIRELRKVLDNDGHVVRITDCNGWTGTLHGGYDDRGIYLYYWDLFGRSANRGTLDQLKWIVRVIFKQKRGPVKYTIAD